MESLGEGGEIRRGRWREENCGGCDIDIADCGRKKKCGEQTHSGGESRIDTMMS